MKFLTTLFFLYSVFHFQGLLGRELSFLPTHIIGEVPTIISSKDDPAEGISELVGFYAKENYEISLSDYDRVRNYLESLDETTQRRPSKSAIGGVCTEMESDYVVHNEIDFSGTPIIHTMTYNCRGKLMYESESILSGDFYSEVEKHSIKAFGFLNPKKKEGTFKKNNSKQELFFAVDLSGSLSKDSSQILQYIESLLGSDISIGLALFSQNGLKVVVPSLNHELIRKELRKARFSGKISSEKLSNYLSKLKSDLIFSDAKERKFFLLSDAQIGQQESYRLVSSIQDLYRIGFTVNIIVGSYFDYKDMNLYQKAARSTGKSINQITHELKIGTTSGVKKLFLYDRKLYIDDEGTANLNDLQLDNLSLVPEGIVYQYVDFPHPNNISEIYSKFTNEKIIQKSEIKSNIKDVVEKLVFDKHSLLVSSSRKVLIKNGKRSFWVYMKDIDESLKNQEINLRVEYKKSFTESTGYINVPERTYVYEGNVPYLLILEPLEIKNFLQKSKKDSIVGFLKGKVLEIK
jgi:hypothetical protein